MGIKVSTGYLNKSRLNRVQVTSGVDGGSTYGISSFSILEDMDYFEENFDVRMHAIPAIAHSLTAYNMSCIATGIPYTPLLLNRDISKFVRELCNYFLYEPLSVLGDITVADFNYDLISSYLGEDKAYSDQSELVQLIAGTVVCSSMFCKDSYDNIACLYYATDTCANLVCFDIGKVYTFPVTPGTTVTAWQNSIVFPNLLLGCSDHYCDEDKCTYLGMETLSGVHVEGSAVVNGELRIAGLVAGVDRVGILRHATFMLDIDRIQSLANDKTTDYDVSRALITMREFTLSIPVQDALLRVILLSDSDLDELIANLLTLLKISKVPVEETMLWKSPDSILQEVMCCTTMVELCSLINGR